MLCVWHDAIKGLIINTGKALNLCMLTRSESRERDRERSRKTLLDGPELLGMVSRHGIDSMHVLIQTYYGQSIHSCTDLHVVGRQSLMFLQPDDFLGLGTFLSTGECRKRHMR